MLYQVILQSVPGTAQHDKQHSSLLIADSVNALTRIQITADHLLLGAPAHKNHSMANSKTPCLCCYGPGANMFHWLNLYPEGTYI
jgi:hypothetical protein